MTFSNDKLSEAEIKTLEDVETGRARHLLSSEVLHRLINWGLVEETTGGLTLTQLGKSALRSDDESPRVLAAARGARGVTGRCRHDPRGPNEATAERRLFPEQ
jgi:hypothetical protein